MSSVAAMPRTPRVDALTPGARAYTFACMVAALAITVPLLVRGLGTGALLPAFVGLVLPLLRWRSGVTLMLLVLAWLVLADWLGLGPFQLLKRLIDALFSL